MTRRRFAFVASFLLLLIGVGRMVAFVAHEPMLGLANNYDMIRVQGCIDAYPDRPADVPPGNNSWQAPIEHYRFRDDVPVGCYLSSEAAIAALAWPLLKLSASTSPAGVFSLRWVGAVKLVLLAGGAAIVSAVLLARRRELAAVGSSLLFAALLTDPAVTLYFNTFYAEYAALLFGYLAIAAAYVATLMPDRRVWQFVTALAVFGACLSKIQHVVFALPLLASLAITALARRGSVPPGLLLAVVAGGLVGAATQMLHIDSERTTAMRHANLTNTVLGAVLPSSDEPARTAERLGLPAACAEASGQNWFTPGLQQDHPCPDLLQMSRFRLLRLALSEPNTLIATVDRGIQLSRPWITPLLGKVEDGEVEQLPADIWTVDQLLALLPETAYRLFFVLPALIALLAVAFGRSRLSAPNMLVMLLLAGYPWVALVTVVFGDGFADTPKQFHLGMTALLSFWLLLSGGLVACALQWGRHGLQRS